MATDAQTINPTPQQVAAIETRHVSIGLSAGAGCGKTAVLTRRLLSHLGPDGVDLPNLIAITFTDPAAREMRDRLRKEVTRRLREATTPAECDYWLKLQRRLHTARISTIHSFCGNLLRAHAPEAGLDPNFVMFDEVQSRSLLATAAETVIEARLRADDAEFRELAVQFGLVGLRQKAQAMIRGRGRTSIDRFIQFTPEQLVACWEDYFNRHGRAAVISSLFQLPCAQTVRRILAQQTPDHQVMAERCAILLRTFDQLDQGQLSADALDLIEENAKVQGGGGAKVWSSPEVYESIKKAFTELRKWVKENWKHFAWHSPAALPAAKCGLAVLRLAQQVKAEYEARKAEAGALDFDDLLIHAWRLLRDDNSGELRKQQAERTHLLLIDEFQDTDQMQVEIAKALCDNEFQLGMLFIVGDAKQSIYRFRGAEPEVFRQLRDELPAEGRLPLTENFRSQPAIINFVNALFEHEIPHYEALSAKRPQVVQGPTIEFLWSLAEDPQEPVAVSRPREADRIARRIAQLVAEQAPIVVGKDDSGAPLARPVRYGDIAMLFRALPDVRYYEEALQRHGVPYYLVGGHAFYSQQEVFDLLNALRAIAHPADEVSLAGALRSPFFGLSDEGLYWLAQPPAGLSANLFAAELPPELSAADRQVATRARDLLRELRRRKDRDSIAGLIAELLDQTAYDAVLLGEFLGQRKLANLHKLIDMARQFDAAGVLTLSDYIAEIADCVGDPPKEALAATQAENSDVVRLMTIHQSKGLEFPVVVVPDLARKEPPSQPPAILDRELGPLVKLDALDPDRDANCGIDLYQQRERPADEEESTRHFYVATTRAADYLILSAGLKNLDEQKTHWMKLLQDRFNLVNGDYCGAGAGPIPQIRVTQAPPDAKGDHAPTHPPNFIQAIADARAKQGRPLASVDPIAPDLSARRRFSFSQISGLLLPLEATESEETDAPEAGADSPDDARPWNVDPRRFGTIVHAVLAEFDAVAPLDVAARARHHAEMLRGAAADADEAARLIERFLTTPRAQAMRQARQVFTELEFLLSWPPADAGADGPLLHGFIDCLYQDDAGRWHLLDYKTNRVAAGQVKTAAAAYELQMLVYGIAAEQILGEPPASLALHFLYPNREREFSLDDASRQRARQWIDQAMATMRQPALA
jgi:ATP-dependent helicase/nuclease subunit A